MKIPKQLKIGGHIYKIDKNYRFKERSDRFGYGDEALKYIKISPCDGSGIPLPQSKIEVIFIHEILHCIDNTYNAGKLDEETMERLSEGLYQVLKDNNLLK